MSSKRKTAKAPAVIPAPDYASKDEPRKASDVGRDLAAAIQCRVEIGSEEFAELNGTILGLLEELSKARATTLDDVLVFQIWAAKMLEVRSQISVELHRQTADANAWIYLCRGMEALERLSGTSRFAFNGDERTIYN